MRPATFAPLLLCIGLLGQAPAQVLEGGTQRFRQWMGGKEIGGAEDRLSIESAGKGIEHWEWIEISREGFSVRQEMKEKALRGVDGAVSFTWSLSLAQMPLKGAASWSPAAPSRLHLQPEGGAAEDVEVPAGAILWPGDEDAALREAARLRKAVTVRTYSFPTKTWTVLRLEPQAADPLPGFADAVRFKGEEQEGSVKAPVEAWISVKEGEVKVHEQVGGLELWTQRAELPPPGGPVQPGLFEQSVQTLPPDPFLIWLPEVSVRAGGQIPDLPRTAEQQPLDKGRWRLTRAAAPSAEEAAEAPITGTPSKEDAPFLAATPLLQFQDPAFEGLLRRMQLPAGLSRWQLAQRVTDFVYEWITDKDYSVGFASALEVCKTPRGDCTEHGVLAVALLRKLGVPARGALGWVALPGTMGLHFWAEVELKGRWVPIDPTFDLAPASAYRIQLATTDLADLGSVGWDRAVQAFGAGHWTPLSEGGHPWGGSAQIKGDTVRTPDGSALRFTGGAWSLAAGRLTLRTPHGAHHAEATLRPAPAQRAKATHLQEASSRREGWWDAGTRLLWADLGQGRWLLLDRVEERQAYELLGGLEAH